MLITIKKIIFNIKTTGIYFRYKKKTINEEIMSEVRGWEEIWSEKEEKKVSKNPFLFYLIIFY